jgi:hypothetical protein
MPTGLYTHRVRREWTVAYLYHGQKKLKTVSQIIYVKPLTLNDKECPRLEVDMDCGDDLSPASIAEAYGDVTVAEPWIRANRGFYYNGQWVDKEVDIGLYPDGLCNLLTTYSDDEYPACGGEKIYRTWTIWDWCMGRSMICMQIIEAKDDEGPELVDDGEVDDDYGSIEPWICEYEHTIQVPEFEDECGTEILLSYEVRNHQTHELLFYGELDPDDPDDVDVPAGEFHVTIYSKDECGNDGEEDHYYIYVADYYDPVPVCEDKVVATMPDDLTELKIPATAFDAGSHDSRCSEVSIDVIRMEDFNSGWKEYYICRYDGDDFIETGYISGYEVASGCVKESETYTLVGADKNGEESCDGQPGVIGHVSGGTVTLTDFDDYVKFCCEDIHADDLMVVLRVRDESGNTSYCMVPVWIDTKAEPTIVCDLPDPLYCDSDLDDAAIRAHFANWPAWVYSNNACEAAGTADLLGYEIDYDDQCGYGAITGTWGYDADGDGEADLFCETGFPIFPRVPFDPRSIKWPPHFTGEEYLGINVECVDGERVETRGYRNELFGSPADPLRQEELGSTRIPLVITMPGHLDCADAGDLCAPEWDDPDCGLVGWSLSVDTVYFEQEVCIKIIKRWTIVDWCRWSPNDDYHDGLINDPDDENDSSCEKFLAVEDWTLQPVPANGVPGADPEDECIDYSCFADEDNPVYFRYQDFFVSEHDDIPFGNMRNLFLPFIGENAAISLDVLQIIRTGINTLLNHLCLLANQPIALHFVVIVEGAYGDYVYSTHVIELGNALETYKFFAKTLPAAVYAAEKATGRNAYSELDDIQIWYVDVDGYYTYDQVIKIVDETGPEIADAELEACAYEDCLAETTITKTASDAGCASTLNWNVVVTDPDGEVIHSEIFLATSSIEFTLTTLDVGEHTITYTVLDGCNNIGIGVDILTVEDCKAPTPYCLGQLSTAVMQTNGEVEIWAVDFDRGSFDNCDDELDYGIRIDGSGHDSTATSLLINCDTLVKFSEGTILTMEMWVFDDAGNGDFCDIFLHINDSSKICGDFGLGNAIISGTISTEMGDEIDQTEITLSSIHPEYPLTTMTENNGLYAFSANPLYFDYSISAMRNHDYLNGVSTLDLVVIQKHILGLETMNSAYKVIAADANNDSNVSAIDLVELRKLILGIYDELPNNTSWRFVDASQNLNINNPFPFTEVLNIDDLSTDMLNENFIGIKVGDVTDNVKANNAVSTEVRTNGTLVFNVEDATVKAGEIMTIEVSSENFNDVFGYQFTMNHTGLTLQSVSAGVLDVAGNNIGARAGELSMSWNSPEAVSSSNVLFSMTFKAEKSVTLSEVLSINSGVTAAEAYVGAGYELQDVNLGFRNGNEEVLESVSYELYQNEPNPFMDETIIGFKMGNSGNMKLRFIDNTGRILKVLHGEYPEGYHEIKVKKEDLGSTGLIMYEILSGEWHAVRKMLIIN